MAPGDIILKNDLTFIIWPLHPSAANDGQAYFHLTVPACTCLEQHFFFCPWKVTFNGTRVSCSVDKGYYKTKSLLIYRINHSPKIHSYHHITVKLSLSLTKHHATKGSRSMVPCSFSHGSRWKRVVDFMPWPLHSGEKTTHDTQWTVAGCTSDWMWMLWRRKDRPLQGPAHSLDPLPTELVWLRIQLNSVTTSRKWLNILRHYKWVF